MILNCLENFLMNWGDRFDCRLKSSRVDLHRLPFSFPVTRGQGEGWGQSFRLFDCKSVTPCTCGSFFPSCFDLSGRTFLEPRVTGPGKPLVNCGKTLIDVTQIQALIRCLKLSPPADRGDLAPKLSLETFFRKSVSLIF